MRSYLDLPSKLEDENTILSRAARLLGTLIPHFHLESSEAGVEDVASTRSWNADPIQVPIGPVTRAQAKKFQNVLSGLIHGIWAQASMWRPIEGDERNLQPITNMIQVQESQ